MIKNKEKHILDILHFENEDIDLISKTEKIIGKKCNGSGEHNFNGLVDSSGAKYIFWNFETLKQIKDAANKLKKNKKLMKKIQIEEIINE